MSSPIDPILVARALAVGPPPLSLPIQPDSPLMQVFSSLFHSGEYSDLVIKCQGRIWKAHKAVVCSQSKPLAAAIKGNFTESTTGEINLEEDEPEIIGFMLEYFYKGNITLEATEVSSEKPVDLESAPRSSTEEPGLRERGHPIRGHGYHASTSSIPFSYSTRGNSMQGASLGSAGSGSGSGYGLPLSNSLGSFGNFSASTFYNAPVSPQNLVTLAEIYIIAEKYDVQPLKILVKEKYESLLSSGWNTEYFVDSLQLIYDGTPDMSEPDALRELAIKTAAAHAKELFDRSEFLDLCKERGDLLTDVFKASLLQTSVSESGFRSCIGSGKRSEQQYIYSRRASIQFP